MKEARIYGMEEYRFVKLYTSTYSQYITSPYGYYDDYFIIDTGNIADKIITPSTNVGYKGGTCLYRLPSSTYSDHKELLQTAKKVYVHPSCKLSRASIATKYKKCLDPWMADVVVMPDFDKEIWCEENAALFINEEEGIIIWAQNETGDYDDVVLHEGDLLEKLLRPETLHSDSEYMENYFGGHTRFTIESVRKAKLFCKENLFHICKNDKHVVDAIMHIVPNDRIVFEDTIMESLGSEETKLDVENLISIKEMLESSDSNTASAALKSLSVMDYTHYPESVKYVLKSIGINKLICNRARNSTSVKFMMDYLFGSHNIHDFRRSSFSSLISEKDFELFRKLMYRIEGCKNENALYSRLKVMSFMAIDNSGMLSPRFKVA